MKLELTELQQITLRDVLTTAGLSVRQIEDIFLLLSFKRERVQLAFYYRACGLTFEEVGERIEIPRTTVQDMIHRDCENIAIYLRESSSF